MMPTCREVVRLLASDELKDQPLARRLLTRAHLLMCDHCGRYAEELRVLTEVTREALRAPFDPRRLAELERAILEREGGSGPVGRG